MADQAYVPPPCEHSWVTHHKPDHFVYWVQICSFCHEVNWNYLDEEIQRKIEETMAQNPYWPSQALKNIVKQLAQETEEAYKFSYSKIGPYKDEHSGVMAIRWQCNLCDWSLITVAGPGLSEADYQILYDHIQTHKGRTSMENYQTKARALVTDHVLKRLDVTDKVEFGFEDTFVFWFCKVLQNWKAWVSTTLPDGMCYEVTYDGDQKRAYIDAYKKFENVTVPDDGTPYGSLA